MTARHDPQECEKPLSRLLSMTEVSPDGLKIDIVASPAERGALARFNDLADVLSFEAKLEARRWRGDGLNVTGEIHARVRQTCVATLEEFDSDVVAPVELRFAPPADAAPANRRRRQETEPPRDADAEDEPDPLIGGAVDLGLVASEFFTLALDPYPRKPGAAFEDSAEPEATPDNVSPFAALRDRRK